VEETAEEEERGAGTAAVGVEEAAADDALAAAVVLVIVALLAAAAEAGTGVVFADAFADAVALDGEMVGGGGGGALYIVWMLSLVSVEIARTLVVGTTAAAAAADTGGGGGGGTEGFSAGIPRDWEKGIRDWEKGIVVVGLKPSFVDDTTELNEGFFGPYYYQWLRTLNNCVIETKDQIDRSRLTLTDRDWIIIMNLKKNSLLTLIEKSSADWKKVHTYRLLISRKNRTLDYSVVLGFWVYAFMWRVYVPLLSFPEENNILMLCLKTWYFWNFSSYTLLGEEHW
jgi:hypothetical protein